MFFFLPFFYLHDFSAVKVLIILHIVIHYLYSVNLSYISRLLSFIVSPCYSFFLLIILLYTSFIISLFILPFACFFFFIIFSRKGINYFTCCESPINFSSHSPIYFSSSFINILSLILFICSSFFIYFLLHFVTYFFY